MKQQTTKEQSASPSSTSHLDSILDNFFHKNKFNTSKKFNAHKTQRSQISQSPKRAVLYNNNNNNNKEEESLQPNRPQNSTITSQTFNKDSYKSICYGVAGSASLAPFYDSSSEEENVIEQFRPQPAPSAPRDNSSSYSTFSSHYQAKGDFENNSNIMSKKLEKPINCTSETTQVPASIVNGSGSFQSKQPAFSESTYTSELQHLKSSQMLLTQPEKSSTFSYVNEEEEEEKRWKSYIEKSRAEINFDNGKQTAKTSAKKQINPSSISNTTSQLSKELLNKHHSNNVMEQFNMNQHHYENGGNFNSFGFDKSGKSSTTQGDNDENESWNVRRRNIFYGNSNSNTCSFQNKFNQDLQSKSQESFNIHNNNNKQSLISHQKNPFSSNNYSNFSSEAKTCKLDHSDFEEDLSAKLQSNSSFCISKISPPKKNFVAKPRNIFSKIQEKEIDENDEDEDEDLDYLKKIAKNTSDQAKLNNKHLQGHVHSSNQVKGTFPCMENISSILSKFENKESTRKTKTKSDSQVKNKQTRNKLNKKRKRNPRDDYDDEEYDEASYFFEEEAKSNGEDSDDDDDDEDFNEVFFAGKRKKRQNNNQSKSKCNKKKGLKMQQERKQNDNSEDEEEDYNDKVNKRVSSRNQRQNRQQSIREEEEEENIKKANCTRKQVQKSTRLEQKSKKQSSPDKKKKKQKGGKKKVIDSDESDFEGPSSSSKKKPIPKQQMAEFSESDSAVDEDDDYETDSFLASDNSEIDESFENDNEEDEEDLEEKIFRSLTISHIHNKEEKKKKKKLVKAVSLEEIEPFTCTICLDSPEGMFFGEIDCHHRFCFLCIQSWSKVTNQCPMCRMEFVKITKKNFNGTLEKKNTITHVRRKKQKINEDDYYEDARAIQEEEDRLADGVPVVEEPAVCYQCNSSEKDNLLLICDVCDENYCHTFCDEKIKSNRVPEGRWACHFCRF